MRSLRRNQNRKRTKLRKTSRRTPKKKGGHTLQNIGLEVRYPSGIVRGQTFTKDETNGVPQVFFEPKQGKLYTLLMWDPDALAKPSWIHWIVTNLETPEQVPQKIVLSYQGPNPPSGVHKYIFGLFEQIHGKISPMISGVAMFKTKATASTTLSGVRGGFDYKGFIEQNGLKQITSVYFTVKA